MRQDGCQHCDRLWELYEKAVMAHTRLESKAKLARLRYEKEMSKLDGQVKEALAERQRLRQEILEHERQAHASTEPSF
jgi:hypothetical protein